MFAKSRTINRQKNRKNIQLQLVSCYEFKHLYRLLFYISYYMGKYKKKEEETAWGDTVPSSTEEGNLRA